MKFAVRAIFFCLVALALAGVSSAQNVAEKTNEAKKSTASKPTTGLSEVRVLAPGETVPTSSATTAFEPSLYLQGLTSLRTGDYAQAVETLRRVVEQNPNDAVAYGKLGVAYAGMKQYKEAVVVLKLAIKIKPEVIDAEDYYQLSNAYNVLEKYSDAFTAIKIALYIKRAESTESAKTDGFPSWADLHYSAGLSLYNLRRYSDAVKELVQVIDADPNHVLGHFGLAVTYLATGDYTRAEREQQVLENLDPGYAAKIAKALAQRAQNPKGLVFVFKG